LFPINPNTDTPSHGMVDGDDHDEGKSIVWLPYNPLRLRLMAVKMAMHPSSPIPKRRRRRKEEEEEEEEEEGIHTMNNLDKGVCVCVYGTYERHVGGMNIYSIYR
jgi:hypothetical protein